MTDQDELDEWIQKHSQPEQESRPLGWIIGAYGAATRMELHPKVFSVSTMPNSFNMPPVSVFLHPALGFHEATAFLRQMADFIDRLAAIVDETKPAAELH